MQENMVCACHGRLPTVLDCQAAAELVGLDGDVAGLPDGYQTLVGEASRVELAPSARLRLGLSRLLLLQAPKVVLIDEADRFVTAVPRFARE
jgi:ABC-type multidrug transport system fused ATPase/permease subunit